MPSLGADMDRGTLVEWRVAPGDTVTRGDIVAVIDTDKSDIEVEVFESGVIEELLVAEGTEVAVGAPLARIGTTGPDTAPPEALAPPDVPATHPHVFSPLVRHRAEELGVDLTTIIGTGPGGMTTRADVERAVPATRSTSIASSPAAPPPATSAEPQPGGDERGARSSPYARRRAAETGIDLAGITGTGSGGAIVAADVELARGARSPEAERPGPTPTPTPAPSRERPTHQESIRRSVARLMARSKREIPHYYLSTTIDLAPAITWLAGTNAERSVNDRILPAALLLKATAVAAARVPEMNGYWVDDAFAAADRVNLGVAVSLRGGGLLAPAIHRADELPIDELMAALRDLVTRARAGSLKSSEMTDPSLTVTNLGDQGVEAVFGVIYPPQVALVGFGKIVERPWAAAGMLGIHPCVTATLSADHRASDGHRGATFLATIERLLADPGSL
jgi:pyruvate dehydrogenase E2 component (dihydrolipoamide acetyltransferase)